MQDRTPDHDGRNDVGWPRRNYGSGIERWWAWHFDGADSADTEDLSREIQRTRDLTDKPFEVKLTILPSMRDTPYAEYSRSRMQGSRMSRIWCAE